MHRLTAPALATALLSFALSPSARAEQSPYTLAVQQSLTHDSNVYRAPATQADPPTDWISTTSVIGAFDQAIGRGRLKLDGQFDINRFRYQHQLDSTAHGLSAELDWSTVDRVSGELGYSDSRQLYRYALDDGTVQTQAANLQAIRSGYLRARVGVVTDWTLSAALDAYERTFSADAYRFNDLRRHDVTLGVIWRDTPDLSVGLTGIRTIGEYPHVNTLAGVAADHYTRDDLYLGTTWTPTGASTLHAAFGTSREDHSIASQRNARRWNGNLSWKWQATGRTQLTLAVTRDNDTGSSESTFIIFPVVNTDARLRTAWSLSGAYALTGKVSLTASGSYATRQLDSAYAFAGGSASVTRIDDRLYAASLGIDWKPSRAVDLSCSGARERRTVSGPPNNGLTYPYGTITLACTGQFAFN